MFSGWGATDIGKQRLHNEDSYLIDESHGLYAIADGVGGDGSGKIASMFVLEEFQRQMDMLHSHQEKLGKKGGQELLEAINIKLLAYRHDNSEARQLASTFSTIIIQSPEEGLILHAGDSSVYGLETTNVLYPLTGEHTLASELKRQGHVSIERSASDALINCIGRTRPEWHEVKRVALQKYRAFLICSDGLNKMVKNEQVEKIIVNNLQQPAECVRKLINTALDEGGKDNITVILIYRK